MEFEKKNRRTDEHENINFRSPNNQNQLRYPQKFCPKGVH